LGGAWKVTRLGDGRGEPGLTAALGN